MNVLIADNQPKLRLGLFKNGGDLGWFTPQTMVKPVADAVAALETIRLGLLRMQAGAGSVESMTGDLAIAREVAGEVDALMQAQEDVERLLGGEGPDQA